VPQGCTGGGGSWMQLLSSVGCPARATGHRRPWGCDRETLPQGGAGVGRQAVCRSAADRWPTRHGEYAPPPRGCNRDRSSIARIRGRRSRALRSARTEGSERFRRKTAAVALAPSLGDSGPAFRECWPSQTQVSSRTGRCPACALPSAAIAFPRRAS
jgi:hypothetical protein